MWTLITGQMISYISEYLLVQLYTDNLSNKNISIAGITIGWLFYEHVPEDFNMTGGKRFMLNWDFRYRFLTQSIMVARNFIILTQTITTLELGTFLILFTLLLRLIWVQINNEQKLKHLIIEFTILTLLLLIFYKKYQIYVTAFLIICLLFSIIWLRLAYTKRITYTTREFFVFLYFIILINQGLHTYWIFDVLFIIQPFILIFFCIFLYFCIIWLLYLVYFTIIKHFKALTLMIRFAAIKSFFLFIIIAYILKLGITVFHLENMFSQNFFQELIIKLLVFNCFLI